MFDFQYIFAGAFTGFIIGLTGIGGGALMTPILLLFFDVTPATAIATDLWFAAITKILGGVVHHRAGQVDWQVAKRLWLGSLPSALIIAILIGFGTVIVKVDWLTNGIGILVLVTAIGLIFAPKLNSLARNLRIKNPDQFKNFQPILTTIAGIVLGICVAFTSVGAGAFGSLFLLYLYPLRMVPHKLVATDMVHAIPLAIVAGVGYLIAGKVDGVMLVNLLLGSTPTVIFGSFISRKIASRGLQLILACILFIAGFKMTI